MKPNPPLIQQLMDKADIRKNTKDNSWDYLNELSDNWKQSLTEITLVVSRASNFLDFCGAHHGEVNVLIEGLLTELTKHSKHWVSLKMKHSGKTGLGSGPEEHGDILSLGLEYIQSHEEFMVSTQFAAPRLQEIIINEEFKLRDFVKETETQETTVVDNSINLNI